MNRTLTAAVEGVSERRSVPLTKAAGPIQEACPDQELPPGLYNLLKRLVYDGKIRAHKVGRELCLDVADLPAICRALGLDPGLGVNRPAKQHTPGIAA